MYKKYCCSRSHFSVDLTKTDCLSLAKHIDFVAFSFLRYAFRVSIWYGSLTCLDRSKICDMSVKIKNNNNNIVLFKDKCLGLALLLPGHIEWFAFFFSLIIVEVTVSNDHEQR